MINSGRMHPTFSSAYHAPGIEKSEERKPVNTDVIDISSLIRITSPKLSVYWANIGIELFDDKDLGLLDNMSRDFSNDSKYCYRAMLIKWSQLYPERCSAEVFIEAIKSPGIQQISYAHALKGGEIDKCLTKYKPEPQLTGRELPNIGALLNDLVGVDAISLGDLLIDIDKMSIIVKDYLGESEVMLREVLMLWGDVCSYAHLDGLIDALRNIGENAKADKLDNEYRYAEVKTFENNKVDRTNEGSNSSSVKDEGQIINLHNQLEAERAKNKLDMSLLSEQHQKEMSAIQKRVEKTEAQLAEMKRKVEKLEGSFEEVIAELQKMKKTKT